MFILERAKPTANGMLLARRLRDFLTLIVEVNCNSQWKTDLLEEWAREFDVYLRDHNFDHVQKVMAFYISEWRRVGNGYVLSSPSKFIANFYVLESFYNRTRRPIPESDLSGILRKLSYCRRLCEWSELVTAVSQSVFNVRTFLRGLAEAVIEDHLKRRIKACVGDVGDFVIAHFTKKCASVKNILTYRITVDCLFRLVQLELWQAGYPKSVCDRCVLSLKEATKELEDVA